MCLCTLCTNTLEPETTRWRPAYYQHVIEQGPDRAFFKVMRVIYTASYPEDATPWQLAHYPHASLRLLRKYLELHPALRAALKKAIERRRASRMT